MFKYVKKDGTLDVFAFYHFTLNEYMSNIKYVVPANANVSRHGLSILPTGIVIYSGPTPPVPVFPEEVERLLKC